MNKILKKLSLGILLLAVFLYSINIPKAEASSLTNADKAYYLGVQSSIAFENAYRGLKPTSATNYLYIDTTYYSYIGDILSSSTSTKFGTTYYSFIGDKLSSVNNYNLGTYYCSYIGDKISSCTNYSLGTIYFNFIGNELSSSSNYSSDVSSYMSYIGKTLSSVGSFDQWTYYIEANPIPSFVSTPTASPGSGTYSSAQYVSLTTSTDNATIYYTTNGFTPNKYSSKYYFPIYISSNTTLKAIAIRSGITDSNVMTEVYRFNSNSNDSPSSGSSGSQITSGGQIDTSGCLLSTDTPTLSYNSAKKARKRIAFTFTNITLTNKKYVKLSLNGRKTKIIGLRRSGSDSIVVVEIKYAKWATGNYNLSMSFKNSIKIPYLKKGKVKYRKGWNTGSVNFEDALTII